MKQKNKTHKNKQNTTVLNLNEYLKAYSGIEVSADEPDGSAEFCGTIVIAKWILPAWASQPILRLDFPDMGVVEYLEKSKKTECQNTDST